MKKNILFITVLWLGALTAIQAQSFDEIDVKKHIDSLFLEYEEYGKFVQSFNDIEVSQRVIAKFEKLFHSTGIVYNDVKQSDSYGKPMTVGKYVEILEEWYPAGLSVQLKTPGGFEKFQKTKKGAYDYEVEILVTKEIGGFTKEGRDFRSEELMFFLIGFDKKLSDFKVLSINKDERIIAAVEEEENTATEGSVVGGGIKENQKKIKNPSKTESRKIKKNNRNNRKYVGIYGLLGVTSAAGLDETVIKAQFLDIPELGNIPVSSAKESKVSVGVSLKYFFSEKIGLTTGIGLHNYKLATTPFSLAKGNSYEIDDLDGKSTERFFSASDITESHELSYINIPIGIEYEQFSKARKRKFRLFGALGLNVSYLMNHQKGFGMNNVKAYNYYKKNPTTEYGYYITFSDYSSDVEATSDEKYWVYGRNPRDENESGEDILEGEYEASADAEAKKISIALFVEAGFNYFLNDNIFIFAGPYLSMGLASTFKGTDENVLLKQRKIREGATKPIYQGFERRDTYEYSSMIAATDSPKNLLIGGKIGLLYQLGGKKKKNKRIRSPSFR